MLLRVVTIPRVTSLSTQLVSAHSLCASARRQYVLPNVEATLTGVRAAVIILLVAALFAGLNYLLLSQGWLQSTLSFEVFKLWYARKHSA
jgi:hypothetical protein